MEWVGNYPGMVDYSLKNGEEPSRYGLFDDELGNDEMQRAQDEVVDFYNDRSQYTKGKGWHLKDNK